MPSACLGWLHETIHLTNHLLNRAVPAPAALRLRQVLIAALEGVLSMFQPGRIGGIPQGLSMSESSGIDSISGGSMPKPYSNDLRARVIEAIEAGGSRCEAAERYEISASAAVLWAQRWEQTGSFAAKPSGGSISRLEEHGEWLLALISEHSDLTLDEVVLAMRKRRASPGQFQPTRMQKFLASCGLCSHVTGICSNSE